MAANILVVDDDPDIQTLMELILSEKGYHTAKCQNGNEAVQLLKNISFDIVLLDLNLPGRGGQSISEFVDSSIKIPIIFITGEENSETLLLQKDCQNRKDRHFIYKPVMTDELYKTVETLLNQA